MWNHFLSHFNSADLCTFHMVCPYARCASLELALDLVLAVEKNIKLKLSEDDFRDLMAKIVLQFKEIH